MLFVSIYILFEQSFLDIFYITIVVIQVYREICE